MRMPVRRAVGLVLVAVALAVAVPVQAAQGPVPAFTLELFNGQTARLADLKGTAVMAYGFVYQPYWAAIARDGSLVRASRGPSGEEELVSTIKTVTAP